MKLSGIVRHAEKDLSSKAHLKSSLADQDTLMEYKVYESCFFQQYPL